MEYAQRIGARIARLRTEKHLTQGQLAQAAGVPRDALARWEAGGGLPGRAELTALARPLGTTAAALLNADEDEPDEAPVGFLTFPRTEQAWRAQARCMRGSGPRTAYALAALCCTVCAALSRAWLFGSVRMACTGFFLAAAAFCLWGCADGPLDCSVSVTPDEGVTWFGQSLTALDRPVEYAKLEFLTPELGFAAVGTQHSPGGGEEKYAFFTHNGGQSWTAFGALPHFGTSHILSGFSMTPDGTAFLTLATGPEENWPLLYCSADSGASWQTAELPWDDCALAYLNHLSRAEQRPEGFYVLLTQLPYSGGNAAFFAPTAQGPWSYAGDAIPDA